MLGALGPIPGPDPISTKKPIALTKSSWACVAESWAMCLHKVSRGNGCATVARDVLKGALHDHFARKRYEPLPKFLEGGQRSVPFLVL